MDQKHDPRRSLFPRTNRSTRPLAPPDDAPARVLITCEDYVDYYLSQGEGLLCGGLEPRLSPSVYIGAYPKLAAFLRRNAEALAERGVVSAEIEAGQVLIDRLRRAAQAEPAAPEPTPRDRVLAAALGKLTQVRDCVRRVARGAAGARLRSHFGLPLAVEPGCAGSLLQGIDLFLGAARAMPEKLRSFRLIARDLDELEQHRRVLQALPPAPGPAPGTAEPAPDAERRRLLCAADACFASLAAAIGSAFADGDARRVAGLKLIPRSDDRRRPPSVRPLPKLWKPLLPTTDD